MFGIAAGPQRRPTFSSQENVMSDPTRPYEPVTSENAALLIDHRPGHDCRWQGLDTYMAVDASGTFSETKRQVGLLRIRQAGVILSDYASLIWKSSRTMRAPEMGLVYRRHRHALGEAPQADRAGLLQVSRLIASN
jgi:hypothetical protein